MSGTASERPASGASAQNGQQASGSLTIPRAAKSTVDSVATATEAILTEETQIDSQERVIESEAGGLQRGVEVLPLFLTVFIGTSNITVFPKTLMFNGGLLFIVCYLWGLLVYTIPSAFMEAYVGQYTRMVPIFGYQRFAPVMAVIALVSTVTITIGGVQALLSMAISMQLLTRYGAHEQWVNCTIWQPTCISLHNDRQCASAVNGTISEVVYAFTSCLPAGKPMLLRHLGVTIPAVEYLYTNITKDSGLVEEFGYMNIQGYMIALMCIAVMCSLAALPIRYYALAALTTQIGLVSLLVMLVCYTRFNKPIDLRPLSVGTIHFHLRKSKFLEMDSWRTALMMSVRSLSLGQASIPGVAMHAPRNDHVIKWLLVATFVDLSVALLCTVYIDGLMTTFGGWLRNYGLNPYDFDRKTHALVHGLAIQALSYYGHRGMVVAHLLLVFLLIFNSFFSVILVLTQTARAIVPTRRRWVAPVIAGSYLVLVSAVFFFENFDVLLKWFVSVREMITVFTLIVHSALFLLLYGVHQVKFDLVAMVGVPQRFAERVWYFVAVRFVDAYREFSIPITVLLTGTAFHVTNSDYPFNFMIASPLSYYLLTPPMVFTLSVLVLFPLYKIIKLECKWGELFRVQEGLSSYPYLRFNIRNAKV